MPIRKSRTNYKFFEDIPRDNKRLKCPFCNNSLVNGSFAEHQVFAYMTCIACNRRIIIDREEYEKHIRLMGY